MEEFFSDSVVSVFVSCARVCISCIPVVVRFESSKKSNNIRMRGPRDTKFSNDVEFEVGTQCTRNGVAAMLGFAARWRFKLRFSPQLL